MRTGILIVNRVVKKRAVEKKLEVKRTSPVHESELVHLGQPRVVRYGRADRPG